MAETQTLQIVLLYLFRFLRQRRHKRLKNGRLHQANGTRKRLQTLHLANKQWNDIICASMVVVFGYGLLRERKVWSFYKPNHSYWERAHPHWSNRMWIEHLRMTKETFNFICNELWARLRKKHTRFRRPISVEARVAMALWRLASGIDYRSIGQLFGVGRSTCCKITHDVCQAILDLLLPRFIVIASRERLDEIKQGFLIKSGLQQCVGALDGSHIPILAPKEFHADYHNRKGFNSIVLQGMVDDKCR